MVLNTQILGEFAKTARKEMGLTQRALAFTCGTGVRFIIDLEKGKPTCQVAKVLAVLSTLGVEITLKGPVAERVAQPDAPGETHGATARRLPAQSFVWET